MLVEVDVGLVLEGVRREELEGGGWVNVVGYVGGWVGEQGEGRRDRGSGENGGRARGGNDGGEGMVRVRVQAIMLWSAGGLRVGEYERAVEGRLGEGER